MRWVGAAVFRRGLAVSAVNRSEAVNSASSSRGSSMKTGDFLKLGGVRVPVHKPTRPQFVPNGYARPSSLSQEQLATLRWMLQKSQLGQDVFLLGVPGHLRAQLVLQYLELTGREYEWVSVTRDTTESDLKQRREIRAGNAFHADLCAVRAALAGRVLVVEGVERAERNLLPVLNNLLENRECQLDDGRFLMHPSNYDKFVKKYSVDELRRMGVERVSENFHVIALGLPVPRFQGHLLDPPLRSRFQCRNVEPLGFQSTLAQCEALSNGKIGRDRLASLVAAAYGLNSQSDDMKLPLFPIDILQSLVAIWRNAPNLSAAQVAEWAYPRGTILKEAERKKADEFWTSFFGKGSADAPRAKASSPSVAQVPEASNPRLGSISLDVGSDRVTVQAPMGDRSGKSGGEFVETSSAQRLVAEMAITHSTGADFGVLGERGAGKSAVVRRFASLLNYPVTTMVLYQDMNSRELLQRRRMLDDGDTVWEDGELVEAARTGRLCVLDGVDRLHPSALEVVGTLVRFRLLHLPDGSRLIGADSFQRILEKTGLTVQQLEESGVRRIHPAFRLVLVGDASYSDTRWLSGSALALVPWLRLDSPTKAEQIELLQSLAPGLEGKAADAIVQLVTQLKDSHDAGLKGVASSLSLRKQVQVARREAHFPGGLRETIEQAALSRFLPPLTKTAFHAILDKANLKAAKEEDGGGSTRTVEQELSAIFADQPRQGAEQLSASEASMIPDVLYYDNAEHSALLKDMAREWRLGAHVLLIGNQGVGKNKVADRFLHLIQRPRHYMQLHRDTTVESLTIQTTVQNGVVRHADSALVRAVKAGHVLVVDEADKAPLHVVAVLKNLLDEGCMTLGDGRRIVPASTADGNEGAPEERLIRMHPDFRMIMLANRPGFPFLGNDLFGVLGDLFAVFAVDNPSTKSQLEMLQRYAPNVPVDLLARLVSAFGELRESSDAGLLHYPYSTRELVHIAKHLQEFPSDAVVSVVRNVFDFDAFAGPDQLEAVERVFQKHGIPLGAERRVDRVAVAARHQLPAPQRIGDWGLENNRPPLRVPLQHEPMRFDVSYKMPERPVKLQRDHMRTTVFSEQEWMCKLPLDDVNICSDILTLGKSSAVLACVNPLQLYYVADVHTDSVAKFVDLSAVVPRSPSASQRQPRLRLAKIATDDSRVFVHEETADLLFVYEPATNRLHSVARSSGIAGESVGKAIRKAVQSFGSSTPSPTWSRISSRRGVRPLLWRRGSPEASLLGVDAISTFTLPQSVKRVIALDQTKWLATMDDDKMWLLDGGDKFDEITLRAVEAKDFRPTETIAAGWRAGDSTISVFDANGYYYGQTDAGFPLSMTSSELKGVQREAGPPEGGFVEPKRPYYYNDPTLLDVLDPERSATLLGEEDQLLVRARPNWATPMIALPQAVPWTSVGGFLESIDRRSNTVQWVPVPRPLQQTFHHQWIGSMSPTPFVLDRLGSDAVLTMDTNGVLRHFQLTASSLGDAYSQWTRMLSGEQSEESGDGRLRLEFDRDETDFDASKLDEPKIGKLDPNNVPHIGGGTWAGGTGGYNTAGLGGVGGPFRLDAGHDVHQMPEFAKAQVPEHILKRARALAKSEYEKRLKEIAMTPYDADAYETMLKKVETDAKQLRAIIEALEAKKHERQWLKHQTAGDLDDAKIVDGVAGERNIYRRRAEREPEAGAPQQAPKRLRLCFDLSGSMYRFNGYDKRLQRSLQAALLVMHALDDKQNKIKYEMFGHSGDGPAFPYVVDKYPTNEKERLDVLRQMLAHTQFCASGDYTLEALDDAVKELARDQDSDEKFAVLLSDANLERYGIRARDLANIMQKEDSVKCFVVLIGSLGEQAERVRRELPVGKAFVCRDTAELPRIMQSILTSTLG